MLRVLISSTVSGRLLNKRTKFTDIPLVSLESAREDFPITKLPPLDRNQKKNFHLVVQQQSQR